MKFYVTIILTAVLLSACTYGGIGKPGSAIWQMTASQEHKNQYYRDYAVSRCQGYTGLSPAGMDACIQSFETLHTVRSMAEERAQFLSYCEKAYSDGSCARASKEADTDAQQAQIQQMQQQIKEMQLIEMGNAAAVNAAMWQSSGR